MKECSKSIQRRLSDSNFLRKYFSGRGVDIGGKPDPLVLYTEFFPLVSEIKTWDWEDGDAQYMNNVQDDTFDFVHSSHCLEHLVDPFEGIKNWLRVIKPGGYLIITVPDEDLYEQNIFPSTFNADHKWTFSIYKTKSWSDKSINLFDLIKSLNGAVEPIKIEKLHSNYRYNFPRYDQSLTPVAECGIEIILRKSTDSEILSMASKQNLDIKLDKEFRIHLNQYRDDMRNMKLLNKTNLPFANDSEL
jgi:SAM-dependent methyltransferase